MAICRFRNCEFEGEDTLCNFNSEKVCRNECYEKDKCDSNDDLCLKVRLLALSSFGRFWA